MQKLKRLLSFLILLGLFGIGLGLAQATRFTWEVRDPYGNTITCELDYEDSMYYGETYTFLLKARMTAHEQQDVVRLTACEFLLDNTGWLDFSVTPNRFDEVGDTFTFSFTFRPQPETATNGRLSIKLSYTTSITGGTYDSYRLEDNGQVAFSNKPLTSLSIVTVVFKTTPKTTTSSTTIPSTLTVKPVGELPRYGIAGILIGLSVGGTIARRTLVRQNKKE